MSTDFQGLILQGHSASNPSVEIEAEVPESYHLRLYREHPHSTNYVSLPPGLILNVMKMCCHKVYLLIKTWLSDWPGFYPQLFHLRLCDLEQTDRSL